LSVHSQHLLNELLYILLPFVNREHLEVDYLYAGLTTFVYQNIVLFISLCLINRLANIHYLALKSALLVYVLHHVNLLSGNKIPQS
jgi:hypothetical protein